MNNIFVLGPVASGKNTFIEKVAAEHDVITLDTGKIFRYVAFKIYSELKFEIDFNKINMGNDSEIAKLCDKIYHLNNYISKQLTDLKLDEDKLYNGNVEIENINLYSKDTNSLLPIIAKIKMIREKILKFIDNYLSLSDKPIIMTGHNIKEIDTTKFTVVFLDINQKESAARLYKRNPSIYSDVLEAYDEVIKRNSADRIEETKNILPYLYNYIYIDTSSKSINEIYNEFLIKQEINENTKKSFFQKQIESINRNEFCWLLNPILEPIRNLLKEITSQIVLDFPYINQSDLIYQTLILIASHEINELYEYSNNEYLNIISNNLNNRNISEIENFTRLIKNNEIKINNSTIMKELNSAVTTLLKLYSSNDIKRIMMEYNIKYPKDNLKLHNGLLNNSSNDENNNIEIRIIDSNMSRFISKYCHYLHTPRDDEFIAYGAFKRNNIYPIAYVSFSKQDRAYKKQLLYSIGIEPQNSIEMTRAWCANSAPINIMSYLFQYSINDIQKQWKKLSDSYMVDKNLQAVTTAINPNLGFKASSFLGCNFIPIAIRPAKFTYIENDGIIKYETRRKIESLSINDKYMENRINILPLNELILCLDKRRLDVIKSSNILLIDKNEYNSVLKGKHLVKK